LSVADKDNRQTLSEKGGLDGNPPFLAVCRSLNPGFLKIPAAIRRSKARRALSANQSAIGFQVGRKRRRYVSREIK
jgi:hypothetical protein